MAKRKALPKGIWALGIVSLLMDISSEMVHGLLPVFLMSVLGASATFVGLVEGLGEATANIIKVFSGRLSDRTGKRKPLAVLGYGLGTLSKPVFALAPTAGWVMGARFADRIGKGIRGAPRDALIADLIPADQRGAAYGLRKSLDNVGAFAGPLLAIGLMALLADDYRAVFWIAAIPGILAVMVLMVFVREPVRPTGNDKADAEIDSGLLQLLPPVYWRVVALGTVLTLARFSVAFVILRAQERGLPLALTPLILVIIYMVSSVATYPVGVLSDRIANRGLLALGFLALILADVVLALAPGWPVVMLGAALWGLHLALTEGLLAASVADTVPEVLRGTGFGLFHLSSGIALFLASLFAGLAWDQLGPAATFVLSAGLASIGLAGFLSQGRG